MAVVLAERLPAIRARIASACRRAGRSPESVTLIGVTKGVAAPTVQAAVALGLTDVGENRVQEAREKRGQLAPPPRRWHLIGHLQRNKAAHALELFDVIHSVDSLALLETLEQQAGRQGRQVPVLLQVNIAGEATKFGCRPEEALALARAAAACTHAPLAGLMTIPPWSAAAEAARPHFQALRGLRDELAEALGRPKEALKLSMGMSGDFEVAIEEGADYIRVGTAIFGERT